MAWNNAVITNKGLEMLRQSIDDGELTVVSASGSDETYPAASLMAQTTPTNEKQSFGITEIKDMDNGKRIRVTITNDGLTTGYVMKQLCVWARLSESEAPQIIAILQDEDGTPIPAEGEIASYLMQFYVLLKVDRTANIKINVENPSFVTYDAIEGMLEDKADLVNGKVSTEQLPDMDYIPTSDKGKANGVAGLDVNGKVPSEQMPNISIPMARSYSLGGIKARTAEQGHIEEKNEIRIDSSTGRLYSNAFEIIPTNLAQATPSQINYASTHGEASKYWSVGDTTDLIKLTTGERIMLQIAGFNRDNLVNGSHAGITFIMKDCFKSSPMNSKLTNSGGWGSSDIRRKMNTYLNTFPTEWKSIIKQAKKKTQAGSQASTIVITNDYLWLPSYTELGFSESYYYSPGGEGYTYPLFTDSYSRVKRINGSDNLWWLRSPALRSSTRFCCIDKRGEKDKSYDANCSLGIALGLCV